MMIRGRMVADQSAGQADADEGSAASERSLLTGALWSRWSLPLLIMTLFLAVSGQQDAAARALLLAHFGLFLLWQPFFSPGANVSVLTLAAILAGLGAAMFLGGNWSLVLWMCVLLGILGGRISGTELRRSRLHLLGALFCLLTLLLFRAAPGLLPAQAIPDALVLGMNLGIPGLLLVMLLVPPPPEPLRTARGLDFFYSLLVFQMVVTLVLGTLLATVLSHTAYFEALLITVFAVALTLLMLALLWNPSHGFSGLRSYLSRYILSVGVPFEGFLAELAGRADAVGEPRAFLDGAAQLLQQLPWVHAVAWDTGEAHGHCGDPFSAEPLQCSAPGLQLRLQTVIPQTPAVVLHIRLLAQLIAEFHAGKCRELQLRQNAYMQAVHETGARLTHDIKNLLQSLVSLNSAGALMEEDQAADYARLVRRQLPVLSARLEGTLEKLKAPSVESQERRIRARAWWHALEVRYANRDVQFLGLGEAASVQELPQGLFDSVAENLLENALRKRALERGIPVCLRWLSCPEGPAFEVEDGGSAVPPDVAERLFLHPASTMKGLGIGLMQAAAQARDQGFRLQLRANVPGSVVFVLRPGPAQGGASTP